MKPTGRKKVPAHLEAEEHAFRPDACSHCGSAALDAAEVLEEEKLHMVKEHQRRRAVRRTTCRCRECGGRTTPRSLPAPYDRSKVTCEWLAWFVHQKFGLLTPWTRRPASEARTAGTRLHPGVTDRSPSCVLMRTMGANSFAKANP